MSARVCDGPGCNLSLTGRQERFCSAPCRVAAWRRDNPRAGYRGVQNGSRRPSRDGKGVRVYVTADDFYEGRISLPLMRKLNAARRRLEGSTE